MVNDKSAATLRTVIDEVIVEVAVIVEVIVAVAVEVAVIVALSLLLPASAAPASSNNADRVPIASGCRIAPIAIADMPRARCSYRPPTMVFVQCKAVWRAKPVATRA
jgi:hypothetical protein